MHALGDSPACTMTATDNQEQIRAFLIQSKNTSQEWGNGYWKDDEPSFAITCDRRPSHQPRAYIVGGGNTQMTQVGSHARADTEPMFTIGAGDGAKKSAAAWLIGGQYMEPSGTPDRRVQAIEGDSPVWTITNGAAKDTRAYTGGRWVRMDIRALGRFQTVPDDYIGLTPQINGNGVPCLLARRIMESLRGCYCE